MTLGALGFGVHPATLTRRLPNSMKKRTFFAWLRALVG
jgi:hypothetical protein